MGFLLCMLGLVGVGGYVIGRGRRNQQWVYAFELGMQAGRAQIRAWDRMRRMIG